MSWRYLLISLLLSVLLVGAAQSQVINGLGDLPQAEQAQPIRDDLESVPAPQRPGTYGPPVRAERAVDDSIPPFGAQLFDGGFRSARASGLNSNYKVLPGDQVTIRAWGVVDINRVVPVDAQGNIFVPFVGPVPVQGATSAELDRRVKQALGRVYTDNLSVYTNLQGVQPIAVFVTGHVAKPGHYAGNPADSVLYFLDQAGGIEPRAGSFRSIRILRQGQVLAQVDLYDFLRSGTLPRAQFEDGDTIVVEPRGATVTVTGDVAQPYRYELDANARLGHELLDLVQIDPGVSHALVRGVREGGPFSAYLPLEQFRSDSLRAGDEVIFSIDQRADTIVVQVEGSYQGPSRFAVPKDATLKELLDSIPVNPALAATESVSIRRESVAERQRQSLKDALARLETAYLGAQSSTVEESRIRVEEAKLIQDFVARAREVQPSGRLVVAYQGRIADIRLQDGDVITIPERSDSLLISGEVLVPQAMVYVPGQSARDYIERAGGFSDRADKDNILVVRQNGEVVAQRDAKLQPGDEILVLPAVPTKHLQLASAIAQILFQVAVTTRTVLDL